MKKKKQLKQFIVRKFILGISASDVLKREKNFKADDCWIDEKWLDNHSKDLNPAIGFSVERDVPGDY